MKLFLELLNNERSHSAWIDANGYDTYFRKSFRVGIPEGKFGYQESEVVLDLANIQAHEDTLGKGHFAGYLDEVIQHTQEAGFSAIYVENVLNKRFEKYLVEKQGFKHMPRGKGLWGFNEVDVCLYKRI